MNTELLNSVLHCPNLPSLPAVAARVVELTSDPNVSLDELADLIQNDQGLSAKVLRTINSSYYGLRQPCSTIRRALVMLGLSPVKSLTLGFSLVGAVSGNGAGFDYVSYWRRGLYSATAARAIAAVKVDKDAAEEAFLGALLQDIGMIALHRTLGEKYEALLTECDGNHAELARLELAEFELSHADVGAMLATKWKLPPELIQPVKYHHQPTAAPAGCTDLVRCVALGNLVHDVLTCRDAALALKAGYARARDWMKMEPAEFDDLVRRVSESSRELGRLFQLDTGAAPDAQEILERARQQQLQLVASDPSAAAFAPDAEGLVVDTSQVDSLTGLLNRDGFLSAVRGALSVATTRNDTVGLLVLCVDGYSDLCAQTDGIDVEIANHAGRVLRELFDAEGGVGGRLGPDLFAVVVTGVSPDRLRTVASAANAALGAEPAAESGLRLTASVGLAVLSPDTTAFGRQPLPMWCSPPPSGPLIRTWDGGGSLRRVHPAAPRPDLRPIPARVAPRSGRQPERTSSTRLQIVPSDTQSIPLEFLIEGGYVSTSSAAQAARPVAGALSRRRHRRWRALFQSARCGSSSVSGTETLHLLLDRAESARPPAQESPTRTCA
ncbi:MAG: HDOD domain-containing protein [Phycisphaeraceae bacterium]|nr:HDOD domain-containing protein [Phycisphaeraceae bacterium]